MASGADSGGGGFSGTKDVADALRFDEARLSDYLKNQIPDFAGPLDVRQFKGGQSNPTYLLKTPAKAYVLRRKPPGALLPSAHAVDREYRVMTALGQAGFPVPETFCLCENDSVIGTMFYVMDFVDGRIFWNPTLPDLGPDERGAVYDSMNATIARLHQFDPAALDLADYGKPNAYVARQIARWSKQYRASETDPVPEMDQLIDWLPAHVPDDEAVSVVHGDYRLDNMVIHPTEPKVIAVLDWELSTLGHPLADFSYHLMSWRMPQSPVGSGTLLGADFAALGIPDEEAYVEAYCRRTGRDGLPDLNFYFAYNFFRLAAIIQGIAGRVRDGTATSDRAAQMAQFVRPLAQQAAGFAERA